VHPLAIIESKSRVFIALLIKNLEIILVEVRNPRSKSSFGLSMVMWYF
jgi:hypothetical protein